MTTPTVRYVIAADDKTRSAIASINKNFQSMEKGVKGTLKGLNLALGVFAGVQLKQAFKAVLNATAESEQGAKSFGKALTEVRDAAKDLLAAKSGLPEATKAMQDLRDTLKDPGIVAAADALTSALIRGFAGASKKLAEFAGGLRNLGVRGGLFDPIGKGEQIEAIDGKIEALRRERFERNNSAMYDGGSFAKQQAERVKAIDEEIAALARRQQLLINYQGAGGPGRRGAVGGTGIGSGINAAVAAREAAKNAKAEADGLTEYVARSTRRQTTAMEEFYSDLEESTRTSIQKQVNEFNRLEAEVQELVRAGRITQEDANRRVSEKLDDILKEVEVTAKKTQVPLSEMSEFAKQAARNMQDAFADFLFDPFKDGVRGMLKGFVDILRRMAAEAAAAKIFDALGFGKNSGGSGGGGGLGDIFKGFASLFGFANGGSFKVGGSGGTDSQLVAFKASPNETVTVTRPDQRMGGGGFVFSPVYNIAPGAGVTEAQVRAISRDAAIEGLRRYNDMAQRNGMRPVKF